MLHHPTKYHPNAITHFLNLHANTIQTSQANGISINAANVYNNHNNNGNNIQLNGQLHTPGNQLYHQSPPTNTETSSNSIDSNNRSSPNSTPIEKSFTIAAILGLNNNNSNSRNFNEVVNLSLNQTHNKLLGGCFDRLPQIYDGNNGHTFNNNNSHHHQNSGHALKNLQQFNQHVSTAFVNREKYKNGKYKYVISILL